MSRRQHKEEYECFLGEDFHAYVGARRRATCFGDFGWGRATASGAPHTTGVGRCACGPCGRRAESMAKSRTWGDELTLVRMAACACVPAVDECCAAGARRCLRSTCAHAHVSQRAACDALKVTVNVLTSDASNW